MHENVTASSCRYIDSRNRDKRRRDRNRSNELVILLFVTLVIVFCLLTRVIYIVPTIRCVKHSHLARRFKGSLPHHLLLNKLLGPKCRESFTYFAQETGCFSRPPILLSSALSGDHIQ